MDIEQFNQKRKQLNQLMADNDTFFKQFGELDDNIYSEGAIPKKYKELAGISISIVSKCNECILYHIQNCINEKCTKQEIIEAIKLGVIGGGSVCYPFAHFAFETLRILNVVV
mgnify:CR=1 FL=1